MIHKLLVCSACRHGPQAAAPRRSSSRQLPRRQQAAGRAAQVASSALRTPSCDHGRLAASGLMAADCATGELARAFVIDSPHQAASRPPQHHRNRLSTSLTGVLPVSCLMVQSGRAVQAWEGYIWRALGEVFSPRVYGVQRHIKTRLGVQLGAANCGAHARYQGVRGAHSSAQHHGATE